MRLARLLTPFSSRNYRLYFGGQIISLIGTWMTQTASLWLAYKLTGSPLLLGVVGFASQIPSFLLGPIAGVWIDRLDRYKLLIVTQILSMLQSLALAWFALTGTIGIEHLILLSLAQGLINAFDMPTRQSLVIQFVEKKEHLGGAIALNSSMFNLARLVGPALGGLVVARFGAGFCYLFDGLSYLAVLAALFQMHLAARPPLPPRRHPWVELREGVSYVLNNAPIRALLTNTAFVSFFGFAFATLMPVFARDIYHGDARVLGLLMSASAVGAVGGALYLGTRSTVKGLGNVITLGGAAMGTGLLLFSLARWLPLAMACLVLVGIGGVLLMASSNTLLQTLVEDDKRGRVMSLWTMGFTGTAPLGSLMLGALASRIGAPHTVLISGVFCLVAALSFWLRLPRLRAAAAPLIAKLTPPPPFTVEPD